MNEECLVFVFKKLILKTDFENTKNIFVLFALTHCYLNLVFYMFYVFFITKKKELIMFFVFSLISLFFHNTRQLSKTVTK